MTAYTGEASDGPGVVSERAVDEVLQLVLKARPGKPV